MLLTATFLLGILACYFCLQYRHSKQILLEIIDSIKSGSSLIIERPPLLNKAFPITLCQRALDQNAKRISQLEEERTHRSHNFNEILGGMLDGALILDQDHVVTFANVTANKNFARGHSMIGRRLEAFVESIDVLETLDRLKSGERPEKAEFAFQVNGSSKVFEVTTGMLSAIRPDDNDVFLLLFRDVTEIKRAELMRKDFVANASHELRTPTTMIRGFAETLVDDSSLPEAQQMSFLMKIVRNSIRLQALVDDLLSLSELEGSDAPVNPTSNKLCDLIRSIHLYLDEKPYVNTDKLRFSLAEEKESFPFDAIKLPLAIGNLVDNAFKYAGDFTEILVSTEISNDGNFISCTVSDDGNGIPTEDLDRIFERFYVVDKGRSREKGGTGLGLSIVKHIVEAHDGQVEARSKLGQGSTFRFTIPRFSS
jgi:signal transduction histidine kinase